MRQALLVRGGFVAYPRDLLRLAPAVHADETPARAAGALAYVHVACTRYLTLTHSSRAMPSLGHKPGRDDARPNQVTKDHDDQPTQDE